MRIKHLVVAFLSIILLTCVGAALYVFHLSSNLPQLVTVKDYKPLLVSEVFDANGDKIGEFYREKRIVVPYDQIPERFVQAFVASEDDQFFEHGGINYIAILRAAIANFRAGRKVQGGSTITQQVARSLMLTSEKTYDRKIKEILLSYKMETNLTKEEILYLYLNQIYLGEGAYGIKAAARIYFRKELKDLLLEEMAMIAGLPQAPSRYSPLDNPSAAKARQRYVLGRMRTVGFIDQKEYEAASEAPVKVYARQKYHEIAPFFVETIRQQLVKTLGESKVLDEGIRIETGLSKKNQLAAQEKMVQGLHELDKRQGYRGAKKNLSDVEEIAKVLLTTRNQLMNDATPELIIQPDGSVPARGPLDLNAHEKRKSDKSGKNQTDKNLPDYIKLDTITDGVVTKVDDKWGIVTVRFAENQGLIDLDTMKWARKPDPEVKSESAELKKPSTALKTGDLIKIKVVSDKFASPRLEERLIKSKQDFARANRSSKNKKWERPKDLPTFEDFVGLHLEQEPNVEGSLLALDTKTGEITSMVGGYDFARNEFNRTIQAIRQTGSSFKPLVFAAGLDNGFTPASVIIDAPIIYEDAFPPEENADPKAEQQSRSWKPGNYGKTYGGDVLFRNALVRSLNIPTVKILESTGISVVADYSRRLGIFSPINLDLSLGLGSSSVTLYEMTKVFAHFARLGKRVKPLLIRKVKDQEGAVLLENLSLDQRFEKEMQPIETAIEEKRLLFIQQQPPIDVLDQIRTLASGLVPAGLNPATTDPGSNTPEAATEVTLPKKEARIFFKDEDQLISPQTAYLMTSLLKGAVSEPGATGGRAAGLGRPVAGKTGTTSSYYDTWFMGYTPQIVTGVWVGYDNEKSLGVGETGGTTALPIWLEYMKVAHEGLPTLDFNVPDKIVFSNIDNETGALANAASKTTVRQAFIEGTEPKAGGTGPTSNNEDKDFFRQDLSE